VHIIAILLDGPEITAWIYVRNDVPANAVFVPGGDYCAWLRSRS
jgi:hypothetical protein